MATTEVTASREGCWLGCSGSLCRQDPAAELPKGCVPLDTVPGSTEVAGEGCNQEIHCRDSVAL